VSSVIDLRAYTDPSAVPTLVLVDLQQEYLSPPRALAVAESRTALTNCSLALAHARERGFPVAFVRWVGRSPYFNPATRFGRWIEGFEPTGADLVFERDRPSCYASESFDEVIGRGGGNIVLAGFAGETACLSTAIDAFHRGHRILYLADASASHSLDEVDAESVQRVIAKVIGLYGDAIETRTWIERTSRRVQRQGGSYDNKTG
jgi:nicotinamidase-related amidase